MDYCVKKMEECNNILWQQINQNNKYMEKILQQNQIPLAKVFLPCLTYSLYVNEIVAIY